ncbi:hypothetical protein [Bradyrhizobium sp. USDA 4353]
MLAAETCSLSGWLSPVAVTVPKLMLADGWLADSSLTSAIVNLRDHRSKATLPWVAVAPL